MTDDSIHAVSGARHYFSPGTSDREILEVLKSWAILQSQQAADSRRLPKHAWTYLRKVLPRGGLVDFFKRNNDAIKHWREEQSICFHFREDYLVSIGEASGAHSEAGSFMSLDDQIEDNDASQWQSGHEVSTTQEHEDSRTNASNNPKGEEVEHLLATNVSASGGLGEEEGCSSTNASRGDSRNARAWETSWHGWVCRHWTNEEWDEWLSQWE